LRRDRRGTETLGGELAGFVVGIKQLLLLDEAIIQPFGHGFMVMWDLSQQQKGTYKSTKVTCILNVLLACTVRNNVNTIYSK
jgi:hypothetical protein